MGVLLRGEFPRPAAPGRDLRGTPPATPRQAAFSWGHRRRLWWLLWAGCPGVGWVRLHRLEQLFGSLDAAWEASDELLASCTGWPSGVLSGIRRYRELRGADPLASRAVFQEGLRSLVPGDPRWPDGVRGLERPPLALYWRGRGSLWRSLQHRRAVAVVGTRRPSLQGLAMAQRLGAALAGAGWPVVSGLAEGIDAAVHRGCLERGGAPVAVLGTPLDRVYPRHHVHLQRQVAQQGLLVSEQRQGTAVQAGHFASRNRLQVALATALIVVECPVASGALHSAERAWREGLPLWVVPADVGRVSAAGSNRLLCRGATALLAPEDLIGQLGPGPLGAAAPAAGTRPDDGVSLTTDQRVLLAAIGSGANLEELSQALGSTPSALSRRLLDLELAGLVVAEAGLCWRPR